MVTAQSHETKKYFVLKLVCLNSGQLQNNFVNGAVMITVSLEISVFIYNSEHAFVYMVITLDWNYAVGAK